MITPRKPTRTILNRSEGVLFAFRCIELLLVVAILGMLAALAA
jgi:type II secretory pathway pseudopilin PulG